MPDQTFVLIFRGPQDLYERVIQPLIEEKCTAFGCFSSEDPKLFLGLMIDRARAIYEATTAAPPTKPS